MAASIRSWIKDRLTRYEAKNKVDLVPSPGAEVQVEKVRLRPSIRQSSAQSADDRSLCLSSG